MGASYTDMIEPASEPCVKGELLSENRTPEKHLPEIQRRTGVNGVKRIALWQLIRVVPPKRFRSLGGSKGLFLFLDYVQQGRVWYCAFLAQTERNSSKSTIPIPSLAGIKVMIKKEKLTPCFLLRLDVIRRKAQYPYLPYWDKGNDIVKMQEYCKR